MKLKLLLLSLCFFTTITFGQHKLLAVDANRNFYELNMNNGAKTLLGSVGSAAGTPSELAYDTVNNTMYVSSSNNDALYTLNQTTYVPTLIGLFGNSQLNMQGMEYHGTSGKLYGMSQHDGGLYEINKTTGAAVLIGLSGLTLFSNLGWDSVNDIMYLTNSGTDSLYTINLTTGAITLVGTLSGPSSPNGLAFDNVLNRMFLIDNNTDNLYTLNLTTGAATLVGSTGSANFLGLVFVQDDTLSTDNLIKNDMQIYANDSQVVINSNQDAILSIELFDLAGRSLYSNNKVNGTNFSIDSNKFGNQILIVKVKTETTEITKKISN